MLTSHSSRRLIGWMSYAVGFWETRLNSNAMFSKKTLSITTVAVIVVAGVAVVFWQPAKKFMLQDACLDAGGKWAKNGNYCIYRECAENNSCKPSYRNNEVCETLIIGISQNELYFNLGMPERSAGNIYTFTGGGAESGIRATIINGVVSELECRT